MTLISPLSVFRAVRVGYIRYQHKISLKSYNLKIESFLFSFGSSFYIKVHFKRRKKNKKHSGSFLSLAITGIDVNDIIR